MIRHVPLILRNVLLLLIRKLSRHIIQKWDHFLQKFSKYLDNNDFWNQIHFDTKNFHRNKKICPIHYSFPIHPLLQMMLCSSSSAGFKHWFPFSIWNMSPQIDIVAITWLLWRFHFDSKLWYFFRNVGVSYKECFGYDTSLYAIEKRSTVFQKVSLSLFFMRLYISFL